MRVDKVSPNTKWVPNGDTLLGPASGRLRQTRAKDNREFHILQAPVHGRENLAALQSVANRATLGRGQDHSVRLKLPPPEESAENARLSRVGSVKNLRCRANKQLKIECIMRSGSWRWVFPPDTINRTVARSLHPGAPVPEPAQGSAALSTR